MDDRTEQKLDQLYTDISDIKVTLAVNTNSLLEHMRRTAALEQRLDSFWAKALTFLSIIGACVTLAKVLVGP